MRKMHHIADYARGLKPCGCRIGTSDKNCPDYVEHPDDYDKCDCRGLEEHARAMGTWPYLAIPKEPYGG